MIFRTSSYNIADVMLQPHDFDLNGNIRNVNALMCRKVASIYFPLSYRQRLYDASLRSGIWLMDNKPALLTLALSQIERVTTYDLTHLSGVSAAPPSGNNLTALDAKARRIAPV